jgi:RHS repeat-associated protein
MMETYTYAGDGKRRQKVTASGTTNFIWDGENVLAELDQNQVTQAQCTHSPGTWGGLVSQRRGGSSSFYGFDQSGSTRALLSPAAAITDSYNYKAFGLELPGSGSTTNPHRYCGSLGYYRDSATRQYARARHLRTDSGRWMSRGPIGPGGAYPNPYPYVSNRPLVAVDPSGLGEDGLGTTLRGGTMSDRQSSGKKKSRCEMLIETAIQTACSVFNSDAGVTCARHCMEDYYGGPYWSASADCLQAWCANPSPKYMIRKPDDPECATKPNGDVVCGATVVAQGSMGTIGICPRSCKGNRKECNNNDKRSQVVLHEAIHMCQNKAQPNDNIETITDQAALCIFKCIGAAILK